MPKAVLSIFAAILLLVNQPLARAEEDSPRTAPRVLGKEDAKLTIIEYSSLTCPHCARFHAEILPAIKEQFIDTGKAKIIYRDYPLDQNAMLASMVARCMPAGRFFPFLEMLFSNQNQWARRSNPTGELKQMAKFAGLSEKVFDECAKDDALATWILEGRKAAIDEYKVNSTPTFVIDGKVVTGVANAEQFAKVISEALGGY